MALPIEDYAVIGDRHTAALVGRDGSIDWLCLPRFDSPACFAALLGEPRHGRWLLGPADQAGVTSARRYDGGSTHLLTTHSSPEGEVVVRDAMPRGDDRADVVRTVTGVRGRLRLRHEWVVRFGYGAVRPWVRRCERDGEEVIVAVAGPDQLVLSGDRLPVAVDSVHHDEFEVAEGDELTFATTWAPSWAALPPAVDHEAALRRNLEEQTAWAAHCHPDVPHRDLVVRSLVTLRLMTHERTGGIVAAPTASLPESFGGERNWDYRYCWLRDASLTLTALLAAGYTEEADEWRGWLLRVVAGDPADLQIMYGVDGARELPERTLEHLPGYADSRPVRVGNGAARQLQTDVLGEVMIALERTRQAGLDADGNAWNLQRALLDHLADHWREADHGLWRSADLAGTSPTRVMVGRVRPRRTRRRAVRTGRRRRSMASDPGPGACRGPRPGYDPGEAPVQHYDTHEVDAALLVIPQVGFLPGDDERVPRDDPGRHRGGPRARRPRAAVPHAERRGTASAGTSTRSRPALASPTPTPSPDAIDDGLACWTGWPASPTTWACSARSTTRAAVGWPATSCRPSAIWRWSRRHWPCGGGRRRLGLLTWTQRPSRTTWTVTGRRRRCRSSRPRSRSPPPRPASSWRNGPTQTVARPRRSRSTVSLVHAAQGDGDRASSARPPAPGRAP
ncbi:MAG: glycoside hydrolase family 15 protein [Nocardioides sp.]